MCGRYVDELTGEEIDSRTRVSRFAALTELARVPRYNISPMAPVLVITSDENGRHPRIMQWWLVPPIADDPKAFVRRYTTFNARAEKLAQSAFYRHSLTHQRCVLPVSGFYEWQAATPGKPGSSKAPFYIHPPAGEAPCWTLAGIWSTWERPGQAPLHSCAILTCVANPMMAWIHNAKPDDPRMPVILDDNAMATWLDPAISDASALTEVLQPYPETRMAAHAVAKIVGDGAHLIDPLPNGPCIGEDRGR